MGWGWGSAALQVILLKLHFFTCNTCSILAWFGFSDIFCYCHTFSTEGEVASCYTICDACQTSSGLGQIEF